MTAEVKRTKIHFGQRLKDFLDHMKMSQTEFAKLIGKSQPTVNRWIDSEYFATNKVIKRTLEKLRPEGINPEYFWDPFTTDWKGNVIIEMDEAEILEMKIDLDHSLRRIEEMKQEIHELYELVERLKRDK